MHHEDLISSRLVTRLGVIFARSAPRWAGLGVARLASWLIACRRPVLYITISKNLRQVVGPGVSSAALHAKARQVLYHAGLTYYDFFRIMGRPTDGASRMVRLPLAAERIGSELAKGRGVLLLATHMSNFDIAGLAMVSAGLPFQALSVPDPGPGFLVLNRMRAAGGIEITPISPESLRQAVRRLGSGGLVITGLDRPAPRDSALVEFFGRPAYLPLGPARLALMTEATVFVGSCYYHGAAGYRVEITGPVEIVRSDDRGRDIMTNTRHLAAILEEHVRACPEQWMMFHSFWPERLPIGEREAKGGLEPALMIHKEEP